MSKRSPREAGFTMLELFVGIALASIVAWAIINLFAGQEQAYSIQEQMAETQQSARNAIDLLTRELRAAGNGAPNTYMPNKYTAASTTLTVASANGFSTGNVINITDSDDNSEAATITSVSNGPPPTITISSALSNISTDTKDNRISLEKISQATENSITFISDIIYSGTILTANYIPPGTTLTVESSKGFDNGYCVYINDGSSWEIKNVTGTSTNTITLPSALNDVYPVGTRVNRLYKVAYSFSSKTLKRLNKSINNDTGTCEFPAGGTPEPVAENIDYIEFRYYDNNDNLLANPNPYTGVNLTPAQRSQIRRIKVQVVARTSRQDPKWTSSGSYGNGSSYSDGYRRVLLESDVQLRNLSY